MHTNKELFDLLFSSGESNINTIIHHLTENDSLLEFPVVQASRGWYSFCNGIYSSREDSFWPYTNVSRPHVCTVNFINHEFHNAIEADWRDIRTPALSKILETQQLRPEVVEWVWILLGRTLFSVKEMDRWEVVPFFQGELSHAMPCHSLTYSNCGHSLQNCGVSTCCLGLTKRMLKCRCCGFWQEHHSRRPVQIPV